MTSGNTERVLVLVSDADSAAETAAYALREARDATAERESSTTLEIVAVGSASPDWTDRFREQLPGQSADLSITFDVIEAETALELAREHQVATADRIVLDPHLDLRAGALRDELDDVGGVVEVAPVDVRTDRRRLTQPVSAGRLATVFGLTYLFYLAIGGFSGTYDLVTGAISAAVVTASLAHIAFRREPKLGRTGPRLGRMLVYLPVLCWEIVKSNVVIAYVILHPSLPIDPAVRRVDVRTDSGMEQLLLANSIALTPGTLVIDVRGNEFHVHELTAGSTEALAGGPLVRGVRYVFHGRDERESVRDVHEIGPSAGAEREP